MEQTDVKILLKQTKGKIKTGCGFKPKAKTFKIDKMLVLTQNFPKTPQ